jgi:anthranilate synthase component I
VLDLPLHGGAVGYLGYDAVREVERVPDTGEDDLGLPDVVMLFPRHVVALDHLRQVLTVVTNVVTDTDDEAELGRRYDAAVAATDAVVERLARRRPPLRPVAPPARGRRRRRDASASAPSNLEPGAYEAHGRGSRSTSAPATPSRPSSASGSRCRPASAFDLYRVLRVINPSPYLYLLDLGDAQIVGSSPEALVQVQGRHVETWPIAGHPARAAPTPQQDRDHERDLVADAKERAEHVMLVDLARNDLGRVCEVGTVRVGEMMQVERYSHVMHLVSSVTGQLREGLGPVDVLRAVFPPAPSRARRRSGRWRSSTSSSRPAAALRRRRRLRGPRRQPRHLHHHPHGRAQGRQGLRPGGRRHRRRLRPTAEEAETRAKAGAVLAAIHAAEELLR